MTVPFIDTYYDYPDPRSIKDYAEWGESIFDVMDFLTHPPIVHLQATATQSLPNGSGSTFTYNKVIIDTHGFFDPTTPTRITPTVPGWYKGHVSTSYAPSATGTAGRRISFLSIMPANLNLMRRDHRGTLLTSQEQVLKGLSFFVKADGTTYFEMRQIQDSGGAINTISTATCPSKWPEVFMRWVKPL